LTLIAHAKPFEDKNEFVFNLMYCTLRIKNFEKLFF
jgi:hypothetical protein